MPFFLFLYIGNDDDGVIYIGKLGGIANLIETLLHVRNDFAIIPLFPHTKFIFIVTCRSANNATDLFNILLMEAHKDSSFDYFNMLIMDVKYDKFSPIDFEYCTMVSWLIYELIKNRFNEIVPLIP